MKLGRIFSLMLAGMMSFSIVSCGRNNEEPEPNKGVEKTGKYVVENGVSQYTILMPTERDDNIDLAVSELQFGIEAATGYKMPATTNYTEGRKYLSIGETVIYEENKEMLNADETEDIEVRVATLGENVFMFGGTTEYSVYAVYEFMEESFGFKWYTYEDYYVEQTTDVELLNFNLSEKPALEMRCLYQWDYWVEDALKRNRRMRTHEWAEAHFAEGHNMVRLLPKEEFADEHPEWYSKPGPGYTFETIGQLCLTNEACTAQFIEACKEVILDNWGDGDKKYFMIGMQDNWDYCKCNNCTQGAIENGNQAGNMIIFVNKVARAINEWVKTIDPNKTIYFPMYAYFYTEEAPVVLDKSKNKYVPANKNVVPDETVLIMYAPLNNSFSYAFDDPRNERTYNTLTRWEAITDKNLIIYSYAFNLDSFFPINDTNTMGGSIGRAIDNRYFGWIEESGIQTREPTMQELKNYVRAQLWWGTEKSVDELAYEFIEFYYRPVAEEFKAYYSDLKQWHLYQTEVMKIRVGILSSLYATTENFPIQVISNSDGQLQEMLDILAAKAQTNPNYYQTYWDRVNKNKLWTTWAYCKLYRKYFNNTEFNEKVDFIEKYTAEYKVGTGANTLKQIASWRSA